MKKTMRRTKYLLLLLIIFISIGYAILQSNLNITGTTGINNATWDIHWNNVQVTTGSVTGTNVTTPATIDTNKTTVNYNITLPKPGDFYEFTVDAVNAGTIDGMIDTISSKLNNVEITTLPNYLNYSVTYSDGAEIKANQELKAGTTETYKVRIEYRKDILSTDLPGTEQTLNLSFSVTYKQANDDAKEVEHTVTKYTVNIYNNSLPNNNWVPIWQEIPNGITQYNTASEAMAAFANRPFYLKHIVQGEIVTESYVEFVVTSAMASSNSGMTAGTYALRGLDTYDENASNTDYCKAEYYNSSAGECLNPYYATNKATLLSAFGSSYCTDDSPHFLCNVSDLYANADTRGYVYAGSGAWYCSVDEDGVSYCDHG